MTKNKWDSIRVYITERCNANCPNCFNSNSRTNHEMEIKTFEDLCIYLKKNGIKKIKIMGGEPTVHKNFNKIIEISQIHFESVGIFTNGLLDVFSNIELRETDSIIYNSNFLHLVNNTSFYFDQKGFRVIELQVLKDTDIRKTFENIKKIRNIDKQRFLINITLDCKSNIFIEKDHILPKLYAIEQFCRNEDIFYSYDHKLPLCYLYKTNLHVNNLGICNLNSSGVIDSRLNLRFCLQNEDVLIPIRNDKSFISWKIIENNLIKKYLELRINSLKKICAKCIFYEDKCNGGCWIPQDFIKPEDILQNTNFPLRNVKK